MDGVLVLLGPLYSHWVDGVLYLCTSHWADGVLYLCTSHWANGMLYLCTSHWADGVLYHTLHTGRMVCCTIRFTLGGWCVVPYASHWADSVLYHVLHTGWMVCYTMYFTLGGWCVIPCTSHWVDGMLYLCTSHWVDGAIDLTCIPSGWWVDQRCPWSRGPYSITLLSGYCLTVLTDWLIGWDSFWFH